MSILFLILFLLPVPIEAINKDAFSAPIKKAWDLLEQKRAAEAINELKKIHPDSKSLFSYHYIYAKAYARMNMLNEAMEHFRLAYIFSQNKTEKEHIFFERAVTYANTKNYDEAALCYKIFLRQFPDSKFKEEAFIGLAEALYNLGNFNEALIFFQKAGNSNRAQYGRADTLHALGKIGEAHEQYLTMINRGDKGYLKSQTTSYNIGENFRLMNKLSFAKVYLALVKEYPLKYKADISNGLIALSEGKSDVAVKHFELALQSSDRSIKRKALLYLSEVYMKEGKTQEAKGKLLEIRDKYPYGKDYDEALLRLGEIYKREGALYDSASILRELVFRKNPNKLALDAFEDLLLEAKGKNNQDFVNLWKTIGQWLLEPSRSDFIVRIVRDIKPASTAYLNVCKWLLKNGSIEGKMYANLLLAEFYAEMGDIKASSSYMQNVKIAKQNDDISRINSRISHLKGEHEKAISDLLQLKNPSAQDVSLFINISSEMPPTIKNHQNLVDFLEKALKIIDSNPKIYLALADAYYQIGRLQAALKQYKTALEINEKNKTLSSKDSDWCLYRIATLSDKNESLEAANKLKKGNDILNRFANAKSKENNLNEKLKGAF